MAKILTLTEYRQENAIWLANELYNYRQGINSTQEQYEFIAKHYINYLLMFGCIEYGEEIKSENEYLTEAEIEEHLKSKEVNNTIEHCHH